MRLVLTCDRHRISSGVFFDRQYAERAKAMLEDEFPGTTWTINTLAAGFRPEGFRHLGEHGVRKEMVRMCRQDCGAG